MDEMHSTSEKERILGLDVGEARIGVAISDPQARYALPLETVGARDRRDAAQHIAQVCETRAVATIVYGWPLTMEGRAARATRRVQRFVDALAEALEARGHEAELERWDERLSTVSAKRTLRRAEMPSRRHRERIDQVAASHILQGYLDALEREEDEETRGTGDADRDRGE
jgi:putative Holliday junction resolvase